MKNNKLAFLMIIIMYCFAVLFATDARKNADRSTSAKKYGYETVSPILVYLTLCKVKI